MSETKAVVLAEVEPEFLPLLDKVAFLANNKIQVIRVDVPELGGSVLVKELTAGERDAFETSLIVKTRNEKGKEVKEMSTADIRAKLCQRTMVGADHKPMFSDEEVTQLSAMSAAAMNRVYEASSKLSGLSDEDIEELAKNSKNGQPDGQ